MVTHRQRVMQMEAIYIWEASGNKGVIFSLNHHEGHSHKLDPRPQALVILSSFFLSQT